MDGDIPGDPLFSLIHRLFYLSSLVSVGMLTMILRKISEVINDFAGSLLDKCTVIWLIIRIISCFSSK